MKTINKEEYEVLKELYDKWKWIARDNDKLLWVYDEKPVKVSFYNYWIMAIRKGINSRLFQFIQWEDEGPYSIAELIEEYERGSEEIEERRDIELLKEQIEIELRMWDGAESGWSEYAVDKIFNLIDKFLLSDKGGNCDDKKD